MKNYENMNNNELLKSIIQRFKKIYPYLNKDEVNEFYKSINDTFKEKSCFILNYDEFKDFLENSNFTEDEIRTLFYNCYYELLYPDFNNFEKRKFDLVAKKALEVDPTFMESKLYYLEIKKGRRSLSYEEYKVLLSEVDESFNKFILENNISNENNTYLYRTIRDKFYFRILMSLYFDGNRKILDEKDAKEGENLLKLHFDYSTPSMKKIISFDSLVRFYIRQRNKEKFYIFLNETEIRTEYSFIGDVFFNLSNKDYLKEKYDSKFFMEIKDKNIFFYAYFLGCLYISDHLYKLIKKRYSTNSAFGEFVYFDELLKTESKISINELNPTFESLFIEEREKFYKDILIEDKNAADSLETIVYLSNKFSLDPFKINLEEFLKNASDDGFNKEYIRKGLNKCLELGYLKIGKSKKTNEEYLRITLDALGYGIVSLLRNDLENKETNSSKAYKDSGFLA